MPPHTQDIIKQLHMNQPGCPPFRQWVMSFQRHNLRLSVQPKAPGGVSPNLAHLVAEAVQVWVGRGGGGGYVTAFGLSHR